MLINIFSKFLTFSFYVLALRHFLQLRSYRDHFFTVLSYTTTLHDTSSSHIAQTPGPPCHLLMLNTNPHHNYSFLSLWFDHRQSRCFDNCASMVEFLKRSNKVLHFPNQIQQLLQVNEFISITDVSITQQFNSSTRMIP